MKRSIHLVFLLAASLSACRTDDTATMDTGGDSEDSGSASGDPEDSGSASDDTCPSLHLDSEELTWTDAPIGTPVAASLRITNLCAGDASLSVAAAFGEDTATAFDGDLTPVDLAPGEAVDLELTFTASSYDEVNGSLELVSDDPLNPSVTVSLRGTADPDQDGDGFDAEAADGDDCDDDDDTVSPAATETWYDGVDADCDGASDYDADGDGADALAYGGQDCDDADDTVIEDCPSGCADEPDGFTLRVPEGYATIQDAIDDAVDGDGICVAAGTWSENLDLGGKAIWLLADEGPEVTIIDGGGLGSVVRLASGETEDTVIEGFTLTGGYADHGGGIYVDSSSATLRDLHVSGNESYEQGAGIYLLDASIALSGSVIDGNVTDWACGGLCLWEGSTATVEDVEITDNVAVGWGGGGIYVHDGALTARQVRIVGNEANGDDSGGGAGVALIGGSLDLDAVVIAGNETVGRGGGIMANNGVDALLTNVTIAGNQALNGGGVFIRDSTADFQLTNVIVSSNRASAAVDGIWSYGGADPQLSYCDVYDNDLDGVSFVAGVDGNLGEDPGYTSFSLTTSPSSWDLHLDSGSALIDAGDPSISDEDGSASDVGAYGGPYGTW